MDRVAVIIVAGGSGSRMGGDVPKQFLPLDGKPVLAHTVERFHAALPGAHVVVALPASETARWKAIAKEWSMPEHTVTEGGENRFMSVKNALSATPECDYIMVHDGVRPLVTRELIAEGLRVAAEHGTAIPAVRPADSFRILTGTGSEPVAREELRAVQTPQVFRGEILRRAYQTAYSPRFTDDASVVEASGVAVTLFEGDPANIKLTTPTDMAVATALLSLDGASNKER